MTKCIILSEEDRVKANLKPIELVYIVAEDGVQDACFDTTDFKVIELVIREASDFERMDLMLCYDDDREDAGLYLGHWNDGVAE